MECKKERNMDFCTCTYNTCTRKGVCCECLQYHLKKKQLPGCCFPEKFENTYDRSFATFAKAWDL